jgi:CRISPR/Cas system Type II protein with McrA/HNH and RuvC-like nuclease domain
MKIVKLTNAKDNMLIYLNIDHIVGFSVMNDDNSKTCILTSEGNYLVKENIDDVLFLVSE